jgi:GMC oxidoreductase/FAD binding domain
MARPLELGLGAKLNLAALDAAALYDVCVIGSGPVGLALSCELSRRGLRTLLLESGGEGGDKALQSLSDAESATENHAPMALAVRRAFGGTSSLWGGRCLPLDAIDFEARPWVAGSGWPIDLSELAPYFPRAAGLLGCGPPEFRAMPSGDQVPSWPETGDVRSDSLERWTNEPFTPRIVCRQAEWVRVDVATGLTATAIAFDGASHGVASVTLFSREGSREFAGARVYVLACGGLETTRLLLHAQPGAQRAMGLSWNDLGRYYMGHVSGSIADLVFGDPRHAALFRYSNDMRSSSRRRMTFTAEAQRRLHLPNIAFLPSNARMGDPGHRNGILSALFLLISAPVVGHRLVAEAIRRMQFTGDPHYGAHVLNVLRDLPATASVGLNILRQRFIHGRRKPNVFIEASNGRYPLHYHAEHIPDASSRVSLGTVTDGYGVPRLRIDLRFSRADAEGVVRAHAALDRSLRTAGIGRVEFRQSGEDVVQAVLAQASDGFHQIGTTRMGVADTEGVVDRNCRVFGTANLYVAGSSVFRSSGQANPTFTAVALAMRLADHLDRTLRPGSPRP